MTFLTFSSAPGKAHGIDKKEPGEGMLVRM
jgi:hypothetical protein